MATTKKQFAVGDVVVYANPMDDERGFTFTVKELRGERLLMEANEFEDFAIRPTFVALLVDLSHACGFVRAAGGTFYRCAAGCQGHEGPHVLPTRACACGGVLTFDETVERMAPVLTLTNGYVTEESRIELRRQSLGAWTCNKCEHCE